MSYRTLGIPSVEEFNGVGIFYGSAIAEAPSLTGQPVFVIGDGNSAGQAALHLAKFASQVTILVRAESLAPIPFSWSGWWGAVGRGVGASGRGEHV